MKVILNQVEKIRGKSEAERQVWTFGLTVFFTSIVVLVWAFNLQLTGFAGTGSVAKAETPSPFSQAASVAGVNLKNMKDNLSVTVNNLTDLFK